MDFSSSVTEMGLLSQLHQQQQSLHTSVGMSKKILEEVRSLHEFSLKQTTRSAIDFVPHKRLIWAFDAGVKGNIAMLFFVLSSLSQCFF
jgi:hypothetical protein